LVERWSKNQTLIKQSQELLKVSTKPNINEIEKIFSVEKVTKEFFDNYKWLYAKLKEAFEKDRIFAFVKERYNQGDPHFTENFVKKLLWQIVFLYFLQKKWWLGVQKDQKRGDGDQWFLRTLYNKCCAEKKLFFNDYLEPLFYDTLNKERPWHWSDYFGCKIPYLNGWLFQPINEYDWEWLENMLLSDSKSNDIFGEILDTFDTFNFTIYENDPLEQDVAVDPEMLGKIFENLLPDNERKWKGAFYTPREIVHYMCKQALIQYLATNTDIDEKWIENLILMKDSLNNTKNISEFWWDSSKKETRKQNSKLINNSLKQVKIIDPAVWSWAFPMGILKEIVDLRRYILTMIIPEVEIEDIKNSELLYRLKKQTLENCIYGVDLDPGAVEIAKLRFWLSLVVDYEGDHIEPLPNLDYKIMQWNSLIENPIIGDQVIDLWLETVEKKLKKNEKEHVMSDGLFEKESGVLLKRLTILHNDYFKETAPDHKKRLKKEIQELEKRLILQKAKETISNIDSEIKNHYNGMINDKKAKELASKYETMNQIKAMTDKLNEYGVKNYFPWRLHFGEIFREHWGFDIVIGNPPYIKEYENKSAFDGLRISPYYMGKMDIWYLFSCFGLDILKDWWIESFIAQNNWITSHWAKLMRNKILEDWKILEFVDFGDFKVFESAGIQTMIYVLRKTKNNLNYEVKYSRVDDKIFDKSNLDNFLSNTESTDQYQKHRSKIDKERYVNKAIDFVNDINDEVLNKIISISDMSLHEKEVAQWIVYPQDYLNNKNNKVLWDIANVWDGIFVLNNKEKTNLDLATHELDIIKPVYSTEELSRYFSNPNNKEWLIYTDSTFKSIEKIGKYPNIKTHLDKFAPIITSDNKPYWLHRARDEKFFLGEKIVAVRKCAVPSFTYVPFDSYVSATFYIIKTDRVNMKFLTGLLNSTLIAFWLKNKWKMQWNNFQLDKEPLVNIPIKLPNSQQENEVIILVDQIMNNKSIAQKADTLSFENKIDHIIYVMYGLTPKEIEIVEQSMRR
jgi:adenine-specific DNA-methyltransferase